MKQIFIALFAIMLFSCNNPDGKVYNQSTEWTGSWEVLPGASAPSQVMADYVTIKPTWGQSFYYSFKTPRYRIDFAFGILAFMFAGVALWLVSTNRTSTKAINIACIVIGTVGIIGGALLLYLTPGDIHIDKSLKVEKTVYDSFKQKDDLKGLWDQLYAEGRIIHE